MESTKYSIQVYWVGPSPDGEESSLWMNATEYNLDLGNKSLTFYAKDGAFTHVNLNRVETIRIKEIK